MATVIHGSRPCRFQCYSFSRILSKSCDKETRDNTALELIAHVQLPQDMQNISMDFARQSDELRRVSEQVRELQTTNHRLLLQNGDFARRLAALESAHTGPSNRQSDRSRSPRARGLRGGMHIFVKTLTGIHHDLLTFQSKGTSIKGTLTRVFLF